jgi:hypothetical protein
MTSLRDLALVAAEASDEVMNTPPWEVYHEDGTAIWEVLDVRGDIVATCEDPIIAKYIASFHPGVTTDLVRTATHTSTKP